MCALCVPYFFLRLAVCRCAAAAAAFAFYCRSYTSKQCGCCSVLYGGSNAPRPPAAAVMQRVVL